MSRRVFAICFTSLLLLAAGSAFASELRSNDPNYKGAFTILAAGRMQGATAKYWTQINYFNDSDHQIYLRLELYPTDGGYRETVLINPVEANGAGGMQWGWIPRGIGPDGQDRGLGPDALTLLLGENAMGALRVVAVTSDGRDDLSAKIHGFARLYIQPNTGGRMSESQPVFTDEEIAGAYRHSGRAGFIAGAVFRPFLVEGRRVNVMFVNFDRDTPLNVSIGKHTSTDANGNTTVREQIDVAVPPGTTKVVSLPIMGHVQQQALAVGGDTGSKTWISYVSAVDNITNDSELVFDYPTESVINRH